MDGVTVRPATVAQAPAIVHDGELRALGFTALRLWVIADNPAQAFYRAMGAQTIGSAAFDLHGASLREDCLRANLV